MVIKLLWADGVKMKYKYLWWCFDDDEFEIGFSGIQESMPDDCFKVFKGNGGFLVTQDCFKVPIGIKLEIY